MLLERYGQPQSTAVSLQVRVEGGYARTCVGGRRKGCSLPTFDSLHKHQAWHAISPLSSVSAVQRAASGGAAVAAAGGAPSSAQDAHQRGTCPTVPLPQGTGAERWVGVRGSGCG